MKKVPINNTLFYQEFHRLVNTLINHFEENDINIGSNDPAGMSHHEIAMIAAWECFHKDEVTAKIIDQAKRQMESKTEDFKFQIYHLIK